MAAAAPDPETMKARARDQWDQAAEAWYRWRPICLGTWRNSPKTPAPSSISSG